MIRLKRWVVGNRQNIPMKKRRKNTFDRVKKIIKQNSWEKEKNAWKKLLRYISWRTAGVI